MPRWRSINSRVKRLKAWDQTFWSGPPVTYRVGYDNPRVSSVNFEAEVGDPAKNAQVAAALRWFGDTARDAWLERREIAEDSTETATTDDDSLRLLDSPNPVYDGQALWRWTERDFMAGKDGCAYWRVLDNADGVPVQIWALPACSVTPKWQPGSTEWVDYYAYSSGGRVINLLPKEVIVFRDGVNPITRCGIPRLGPAYPLLAALNEIPVYLYLLLKKLGMPGLVFSAEEGTSLDPEDMDKIRVTLDERTTGDNKFRTTGVPYAVKFHTIGRSPEEMRIDRLPIIPESITSALIGINSMVSGLPSGAESKTYANLAEAVQDAFKTVRNVQACFAATLTKHLLPRFGAPASAYYGWNYSEVPALREAADAVSRRTLDEWDADTITLDECRTKLGYDLVGGELGPLRKTELISRLGGGQQGVDKAKDLANGGDPPAANDFDDSEEEEDNDGE